MLRSGRNYKYYRMLKYLRFIFAPIFFLSLFIFFLSLFLLFPIPCFFLVVTSSLETFSPSHVSYLFPHFCFSSFHTYLVFTTTCISLLSMTSTFLTSSCFIYIYFRTPSLPHSFTPSHLTIYSIHSSPTHSNGLFPILLIQEYSVTFSSCFPHLCFCAPRPLLPSSRTCRHSPSRPPRPPHAPQST